MLERTYSELKTFDTFVRRYKYLAIRGDVGSATFGFDRFLNQQFYRSTEWKRVRDAVIVRDNGCDLGVEGYEIHDRVYIHHMNPMTVGDIVHSNPKIFDPNFLITTTHRTHNAIHYGDDRLLPRPPVERRPGDTKLW